MINKRVVIITGTSRGIGLGMAKHFLEKGDIVCGCSRGVSELKDPKYLHFQLDVSDEKAVVSMVRAVERKHGTVGVLLNNAGIATMNLALLSPAISASEIFAVNFHGTFLFCREVAKSMVRRKSGRIVNFTTVARPLRIEGESLYAASKAAVESFTQILASELGSTGVTVNAIGPTPIPTDLVKNVPKGKLEALLARQGIRRFGSIADVVNVVEFFISPQSDFVTGQVIYLGGVNG
jgi:3-oxoacyl-[acyl-carrier protein] reductase